MSLCSFPSGPGRETLVVSGLGEMVGCRWWGAIPVPSRNSLEDVAHPCLAVIVLHPPWAL